MAGALLVTGATGLVGGQIAARYLERTDRQVFALVRAADDAEAGRRVEEALAATYGLDHGYGGRVTGLAGDLEQPGLGLAQTRLDELAGQVTTVAHAAASVSFAQPLDEARRINVEGTERVLEFARLCERRGALERFAYVSTTYVAGAYDGHFTEDDGDVGQEFRNSYERSKLEADQLVRREAGSLPVRIFRPGIVVGEHQSGWTSSFNVLYFPLKLFAKGRNPPIVPARRDTPIDAVPIDYAADAIFELTERGGEIGTTFHLVAGKEAGTIGELLDMAADSFGRRKPTLMPLSLYMHTLHHVLRHAYRGQRKRQILQAADYLPYFSMRQTFDNRRAQELLE
ncbi:MAG: hypothetical protein QOD53_838, partial [Thermoleophilaceae bacterium]|nr:hypothetical protein [Thermoleophilaceae bacterium]